MQTVEPLESPQSGLATVEQAAKFLNLCRTTVYAMLRDNQLTAVKIRNATRIPWAALHKIADADQAVGR